MDQNFIPAYSHLGEVYLLKSKYEEAMRELKKALVLSKRNDPYPLTIIGITYAKSGNKTEAEKTLKELFELSKQKYVPPALIAALYMGLDQKDQAFEWLDKAYRERSSELLELRINPLWDDLRPDPRFSELLKKIGLENE
jgi:tetratricopeptide (TPR) repeat protein